MPDFRQVCFDAGQNKVRSDFDGAQLALVKGRWVDIRIRRRGVRIRRRGVRP